MINIKRVSLRSGVYIINYRVIGKIVDGIAESYRPASAGHEVVVHNSSSFSFHQQVHLLIMKSVAVHILSRSWDARPILMPIDSDSRRARASHADTFVNFIFEPSYCSLVIPNEGFKFLDA